MILKVLRTQAKNSHFNISSEKTEFPGIQPNDIEMKILRENRDILVLIATCEGDRAKTTFHLIDFDGLSRTKMNVRIGLKVQPLLKMKIFKEKNCLGHFINWSSSSSGSFLSKNDY